MICFPPEESRADAQQRKESVEIPLSELHPFKGPSIQSQG